MITISLCMIVKDEECCLANCLSSVKDIVDEFIIVDTGSTDRTKDIIQQFSTTVYSFTWKNDFSAARNYSFSLATKDYILWLDADDIISPENLVLLKELKETLTNDVDFVQMTYDIAFNAEGKCTLSIHRDKLVKNHQGFYWRYFIHEELVTWGKSMTSNIHITHTSDHGSYSRYLKNFEQRIADGYELLPHELYFYGGELFMSKKYDACINVLEKYIVNPSENTYEQTRAMDYLCICYHLTNQHERALKTLLHSFEFIAPTGLCCYYLGQTFQMRKKWNIAIFWYMPLITGCILDVSPDLILQSHLQLSICYNALGNLTLAIFYNNKVLVQDPDNRYAKANKVFFDSIS